MKSFCLCFAFFCLFLLFLFFFFLRDIVFTFVLLILFKEKKIKPWISGNEKAFVTDVHPAFVQ